MAESPSNHPPWFLMKTSPDGQYHLGGEIGCRGKIKDEEIAGDAIMVNLCEFDEWLLGEGGHPPVSEWCDECLRAASKVFVEAEYS